MINVVGNVI